MASGLAALGAAFAVAGGWIGPGLAAATALGLGRDRLERAVLGVALGRLLLALVTLAATAAGAQGALVAWGALGLLAGGWALRRSRSLAATGSGVGVALAVGAGCALLLVHAVVFRSALEQDGVLPFFGRDSANDPFVYGAYALALQDLGPPLANPFAGGGAVPGSYAQFAVLAGLASIGATPMLHLVYHVLPLFECLALMATAIATTRALGAPRAAWLAPLVLLAGDAAPVVTALAQLVGWPAHPIDSFALFGPYLLAMNPITPALQTLFCALLLLARAAPRRTEAWVAGGLVGALIEIKLFLWAPALAGLLATVLVPPPAALRAASRHAAAAALLCSLPSVIDKLRFAAQGDTRDLTGFSLCFGCLPRYLARAAWGDGELSVAIFRAGTIVAPRSLLMGAVAAVAITAVVLGVRAFGLPELARGWRKDTGAIPYRVLGFASAAGVVLAMTVGAPPHYLNAAQFAWVAVFGLAPLVAIAAARWIETGRWLPLALATLLAVPAGADAILRLGYGAPQRFAISRDERELCAAITRVSAPGDVVFEPSMIRDTDVPSPIPLLAGRPVYLSLLSAVGNLSADERDARFARLVAFFASGDAIAARRALAESRAAFVWMPAGVTAVAAGSALLEPVFENAAGKLYRVAESARRPTRESADAQRGEAERSSSARVAP